MRGKLDLPQTIKTRIQHKPQVACTFDELSEDNLYNQILKTTLQVLLRDKNVSTERKVELKKALLFLDTVLHCFPLKSHGSSYIISGATRITRCC